MLRANMGRIIINPKRKLILTLHLPCLMFPPCKAFEITPSIKFSPIPNMRVRTRKAINSPGVLKCKIFVRELFPCGQLMSIVTLSTLDCN